MGKQSNNKRKSFKKESRAVDLDLITPDGINTFSGVVDRALGSCQFLVKLHDNTTYKTRLPGSSRKGKRTQVGDMVMIELSGLNCGIDGFIIYTYTDDDLYKVQIKKISVDSSTGKITNDHGIIFGETNDEDDDDKDLEDIYDFDNL